MAQSALAIICPGCGQAGFVVREGERRPVSVTSGFHLEARPAIAARPSERSSVVVCDRCDEIQPD